MRKILYRYEIMYKNEDGDTEINLREYPVVRESEKSYWYDRYGVTKIVRKTAYSAFAHDDKEDAMEHFLRRTKKRISWYKYWIEECEKALDLARVEL